MYRGTYCVTLCRYIPSAVFLNHLFYFTFVILCLQFTQKPLTEVEAKKQREKEKEKKPRARSDSISSSEGTNTKQRGRKPASVNMKVDPTSSSQLVNGVHSTQNSAVDSLSLLQQTSNIMGTFVKSENISNGVTSVSHNNDDLSSSLYGVSQVQFSVNDLLRDKPKSSARTSTHLEKYSVREKTTPLNRPLPGQNSSQQKPTSSQKPTQEKEKVISQPKPPPRDSRKRKSDRKILDKKAKKQKLLKKQSEKKKLQKKKKLKLNNSTDKTDKTDKTAHDRSVEKAIPKPSKLGLLENGEIRPFSPLGHE